MFFSIREKTGTAYQVLTFQIRDIFAGMMLALLHHDRLSCDDFMLRIVFIFLIDMYTICIMKA